MKRIILLSAHVFIFFLLVTPVFAQVAEVDKIQNFIQNIINILVTMAGLVSVVFIVLGGLGYITSSGNPEHLERSKRTILYSAFGLSITLAAFVLSNIVTQLATSAFGR
jgi:hypothetical protein